MVDVIVLAIVLCAQDTSQTDVLCVADSVTLAMSSLVDDLHSGRLKTTQKMATIRVVVEGHVDSIYVTRSYVVFLLVNSSIHVVPQSHCVVVRSRPMFYPLNSRYIHFIGMITLANRMYV